MNSVRLTLQNPLAFIGLKLAFVCLLTFGASAADEKPFEHHMHLAQPQSGARGVAITLDACSGGVDYRVLNTLLQERIPATLFITARWLANNADVFKVFLAHPDLFQIEDHGKDHVPPVLGTEPVYGITPAGTKERIAHEIAQGSVALVAAGALQPSWYRGATALYSPEIVPMITAMGYRIAGFSLNADYGASASAATAQERISGAVDGDVVIAHINQPKRAAGAGIAQGLMDLKKNGTHFVLLRDREVVNE